jgi:beta-phosphoglucomutase-like phosphatase (HAD superfamily)
MKLGRFNLADKFKVLVTASEVTRRKPHPEPYQKAVQLLHIAPENALVIEDNPSGIKSAKAAGCKAIAYPNGFTKDMDFSEADMIIFSLQDIDDELLRLV